MNLDTRLLIENKTLRDENNYLKGEFAKMRHNIKTIMMFLDGMKRHRNRLGNMEEIIFIANALEGNYSELITLKDGESNNAV